MESGGINTKRLFTGWSKLTYIREGGREGSSSIHPLL